MAFWGGGTCLAVAGAVSLLYHQDVEATRRIHLQLRQYGFSVYEYHSRSGDWPRRVDDLAQTSLSREVPDWGSLLRQGEYVMVWHRNLKPKPRDNAHEILVYHGRDALAGSGYVWVCWGDLHTEYLKAEQVAALVIP
jgi:hypothetical protein